MYNEFKYFQQSEVIFIANISDRIRLLRKSAGLTQEQFGNIFGIVKSTVSLYESGKSTPNDQIKLKICNHFDVTLDFLIGLSSISSFKTDKFNSGIINDGSCNSRFIDLLEIRNKSFTDISTDTGIAIQIIENWFKTDAPSLQQLVLVADSLDTSIDYLLGRTDRYNQPSEESIEILNYYYQLKDIDRRWIVGQMIDIIKKDLAI